MKQPFALIIALLVLTSCSTETNTTSTPFKIGVILSLTGDGARFGQDAQQALDSAYAALSPEEQKNIKLIIEPISSLSSTDAVTAYHKLHDVDGVDVLIVWGSGPSSAVSPLSNADHIPFIAISGARKVTNGTTYTFRHYIDYTNTGAYVFETIKKQGYNNLGFLIADYSSKTEMCGEIKRLAEQDPALRIVYSERVDSKEKDLRTYAAKMKEAGIDTALICLHSGQLLPFAKTAQEQQLRFKNPIQLGLGDLVTEISNSTAPAFYEQGFYPEPCTNEELEQKFLAQHGHSASQGTFDTYDAFMLFVRSVQQGKKTPEQIQNYLFTLNNYAGTIGTYSADGNYGFTIPLRTKTLFNGAFTIDRSKSNC